MREQPWHDRSAQRPKFGPFKMAAPYRKIGIIREGKVPADRRVPLTPAQCKTLLEAHPELDLVVQRSPVRAYTDDEYAAAGVPLVDELEDRELIIGIKEVPVEQLLVGKSYLFFSHTIKEQPHNRKLMHAVIEKGITLMDHEVLTDPQGNRVLAFGYWAGVVGAYNGIRAWEAIHEGVSGLQPAHECRDLNEMEQHLHNYTLPKNLRIVLTGGGRVGKGAMGVLERTGVERVTPKDFLEKDHDAPVYTVLGSSDLYVRNDGMPFDKAAFHTDPSGHRAHFKPFADRAQLYIACHFWDPRGPKILRREDLADPQCSLRVVADISCDIDGPIDSTVRASTIAEPFYGYSPDTGTEVPMGTPGSVTVMAVDNLPCELPRDASETFGNDLIARVMPALLGTDVDGIVDRATIVREGTLTERFGHLKDYANG